ncbi:YdgA family protein [Stutzerimonas stutzeri]|uniref:YdgA family protein n=1 Tax=Stutzerimonas stutzeri TaxID=316 RepID=UPI001C2ECF55|nr:YdgA family protein [Stutzerimonas stutzeri]
MKKLALAVAVPLALFGAATFYTSTQVETTARDAVEQANVKLREMSMGAGAEVTLKLLSFDRGLLSSSARYEIDVQVPDDDGGTRQFSVLLHDHLEHGPFPISRLARGQLMPVAAQSHFQLERSSLTEGLFEAAAGEIPLVGDVTIGYDGRQYGDMRSAAFNLQNEDGTVRVSPAVVSIETTQDATTVRLNGELPELDMNLQHSVSGQPVRLSLRGLGLSVDNHEDANGFALGPSAITLKRMEIQTGDEPAVIVQNASFDAALSEGARGLDLSTGYRVGQVDAQGQTFRNLALVFGLRNLEASKLKALVDRYKAILDSGSTPQESLASLTAAQQQELQALGLQLLEHNPTLAVDEFGFETAHGAARLSVVLDLREPSAEAFTPDAMITSMLASLKADASVDKDLVRDVAGLVAQRGQPDGHLDPVAIKQEADATTDLFSGLAIDSGWSRLDGEHLVSTLHYANDRVNLNGRDMSVQEFMAFAFGSAQGAGLLGQ